MGLLDNCLRNSVTFGHLFRGLFHLTIIRLNFREIKPFDYLKQLTIATDSYTTARGTNRLCKLLIFRHFTKSCFCIPQIWSLLVTEIVRHTHCRKEASYAILPMEPKREHGVGEVHTIWPFINQFLA